MSIPGSNETRVVIVDDSPSARHMLSALLQSTSEMRVVGVAADGQEGIRLVNRLRPDVVLMDISMPGMDGLAATREIMDQSPTPIVIVSSSLTRQDVDLTFQALEAGALTIVRKPGLSDPQTCEQILEVIRLMSRVPVDARAAKAGANSRDAQAALKPLPERQEIRVIGIAASTGGPAALAEILGALPADYPVPILGVPQIAKGFSGGLADWLDTQTALRVAIAGHGESPHPGSFLLPPSDYHIQVNAWGLIELSKAPPVNGIRPSANVLFQSLANNYGPRAAGIVLSGMGDDGAEGMWALHQSRGLTVVQSQESSIASGMPQEVVLRNAADCVLAPAEIADLLRMLHPTDTAAEVAADV